MYGIYGGVVLVATLHAIGWFHISFFEASAFFVILAAMICIAVVVQGDSPTRADAFWASRPLQPSAVASAKIVQVGIIIAIALVGQIISMFSRGVPDLVAHFIPAMIGTFGLWILAALAAAVVTKELQGAIVAFIGMAVLFGIALSSGGMSPTLTSSWRVPLAVAEAALALVTLYVMYHSRDRRLPLVVAGCVACMGPLIMLMPNPSPARQGTIVTPNAPRQLRASFEDSVNFDSREIRIHVAVDGVSNAQHATLSETSVAFTLTNGEVVYIAQQFYVPITLGDSIVTPQPLRWFSHGAQPFVGILALHPTDVERSQLARGVRHVSINGTVVVHDQQYVATMPLREQEQLRVANRRVLVDSVIHGGNDITARLFISVPERSEEQQQDAYDPYMNNTPRFALVNDVRHEAITANSTSTSISNFWLVMPGMMLTEQSVSLTLRKAQQQATVMTASPRRSMSYTAAFEAVEISPAIDDAWLRDAKLLMFDWKFRAKYRVRAEVNVQ